MGLGAKLNFRYRKEVCCRPVCRSNGLGGLSDSGLVSCSIACLFGWSDDSC